MKRYTPYIYEDEYREYESARMKEEALSGEWIKYNDYQQERKQLLKALSGAVNYIEALEEAIADCPQRSC